MAVVLWWVSRTQFDRFGSLSQSVRTPWWLNHFTWFTESNQTLYSNRKWYATMYISEKSLGACAQKFPALRAGFQSSQPDFTWYGGSCFNPSFYDNPKLRPMRTYWPRDHSVVLDVYLLKKCNKPNLCHSSDIVDHKLSAPQSTNPSFQKDWSEHL